MLAIVSTDYSREHMHFNLIAVTGPPLKLIYPKGEHVLLVTFEGPFDLLIYSKLIVILIIFKVTTLLFRKMMV